MIIFYLFDLFILFWLKDIVFGDFYWVVEVGGDFFLVICDSIGYGVLGVLMSVFNIIFLNEVVSQLGIIELGCIFDYVCEWFIILIVYDGVWDGMDGILLCLCLKIGEIYYVVVYNVFIVF